MKKHEELLYCYLCKKSTGPGNGTLIRPMSGVFGHKHSRQDRKTVKDKAGQQDHGVMPIPERPPRTDKVKRRRLRKRLKETGNKIATALKPTVYIEKSPAPQKSICQKCLGRSRKSMSVRRRECRSYSEKARIAYAAIEVLLLRGVNTEHLRHYRNKGMAEASPTIQHYIEQYRLQDTQTLLDMIWHGVPTIISKPTKKEKAAISRKKRKDDPGL